MRGKSSFRGLVTVFRELQSRSASGVLRVATTAGETRILFESGVIVRADASHPEGAELSQDTIVRSVFRVRDGHYQFDENASFDLEAPRLNIVPEQVTVSSLQADEASPPEMERPSRADVTPPENASETMRLDDRLGARSGRDPGSDTLVTMPLFEKQEAHKHLSHLVDRGVAPEGGNEAPRAETRDNAPKLPASPRAIPAKLGRYEVQGVLGRGSTGTVLLARDPAIDRVVAVKLVQIGTSWSPTKRQYYRERFYHEATSAGALNHPNIVAVFDVGHTEDDAPFIVMERVEGQTLDVFLEKNELSVAHALRIAHDVLAGLGFAHTQGIVHRTLKPSNIIVTRDFNSKVMNLGIAHATDSEIALSDGAVASPYYMAPEQIDKGPVDQRADLFALGVLLYRMLTHELPFDGLSFPVQDQILNATPFPPDRLRSEVNAAMRNVILRCLEKSPSERYETAEDVADALETAYEASEPKTGVALKIRREVRSWQYRWLPATIALTVVASILIGLLILGRDDLDVEAMGVPTPPAGPTISPALPLALDDGVQASTIEPATADETEPPDVPAPQLSATAVPRPRAADPPESGVKLTPSEKRPGARAPVKSHVEPEPKREPEIASAPHDLLTQARGALERGDLEQSQALLTALLQSESASTEASELLAEVADRIWARTLPLTLNVRHQHRLGGCDGILRLTARGLEFASDDHAWNFAHEIIQSLERRGKNEIYMESSETAVLGLGVGKRYRFAFAQALPDAEWARYTRLTR